MSVRKRMQSLLIDASEDDVKKSPIKFRLSSDRESRGDTDDGGVDDTEDDTLDGKSRNEKKDDEVEAEDGEHEEAEQGSDEVEDESNKEENIDFPLGDEDSDVHRSYSVDNENPETPDASANDSMSEILAEDDSDSEFNDGEEAGEFDLFARLEESRAQLEEELGAEKLMKVYKTVQALQENEDENMEEGARTALDLLGEEKVNLYPNIFQLVMADAAFTDAEDDVKKSPVKFSLSSDRESRGDTNDGGVDTEDDTMDGKSGNKDDEDEAEDGEHEEDEQGSDEVKNESKKEENIDYDSDSEFNDGEEAGEFDLFARLEESRAQLEEELGAEKLMKVYKTVQALQEDEDENMEEGARIAQELLGEEKVHLYPKIFQLVMADAAFTDAEDDVKKSPVKFSLSSDRESRGDTNDGGVDTEDDTMDGKSGNKDDEDEAEDGEHEEDEQGSDEVKNESKKEENIDYDSDSEFNDGEEAGEFDLFARLEESRAQLEEELGAEKLMKVYKTVQALQEDEDENMEEGARIAQELLGEEKVHLYPKIFQLVMADAAFTDDNLA